MVARDAPDLFVVVVAAAVLEQIDARGVALEVAVRLVHAPPDVLPAGLLFEALGVAAQNVVAGGVDHAPFVESVGPYVDPPAVALCVECDLCRGAHCVDHLWDQSEGLNEGLGGDQREVPDEDCF